jgi:hypothetical protein
MMVNFRLSFRSNLRFTGFPVDTFQHCPLPTVAIVIASLENDKH